MSAVNWAAAGAIATWVQDAIICATVIVAFVQVRDSRRAAQFDATRNMIARSLDPEFYHSLQYVFNELDAKLHDDGYVRELSANKGWNIDAHSHPELIVLARLEELGVYLRHRLLSRGAILDFSGELIVSSWEQLLPAVRIMRESHRNPHVWENAEYLYDSAGEWIRHRRTPRPPQHPPAKVRA